MANRPTEAGTGALPRFRQQSLSNDGGEKLYDPWDETSRVCGLRKKTFWLVIGVVVFAAVIGVGIGLGVGLTSRIDESSSASSPTSTSTSPSSSTASPTSSSSTATPSPTRSADVESICPGANNTLVVPDLGTMQYRVLCDRDFEAQRQTDASSSAVESFDSCLMLCDTLNSFSGGTDIAASFNAAGVSGEPAGTCWCIGDPNKLLIEKPGNDIAFALPIA